MLEKTGSNFVCVFLIVPVIIHFIKFNYMSTLLHWALLIQTGAQYSLTLYTEARIEFLFNISVAAPAKFSNNIS